MRSLRKEAGLSQKQLADALSVSQQSVSQWERGVSAPSVEHLDRLSQLLPRFASPSATDTPGRRLTVVQAAAESAKVLSSPIEPHAGADVARLRAGFLDALVKRLATPITSDEIRLIRDVAIALEVDLGDRPL